VDLLVSEVILHHLTAAGVHGLRIFDEDPNPFRIAAFHHPGQFGRIVRSFAENGVASHTVVLIEDQLSPFYGFGQVLSTGLRRNAGQRVKRQTNKERRKKRRPTKEKPSSL